MTDDQAARLKAVSQQQETRFFIRVIGIIDQASALIREDGLCVFKGHAMLPPIGRGLLWIPLEVEGGHRHIVRTWYGRCNRMPDDARYAA